jgi:hypothetical protein
MFAHKSVPHLSSHCALAHMAKTLSFHNKFNLFWTTAVFSYSLLGSSESYDTLPDPERNQKSRGKHQEVNERGRITQTRCQS